jgi:hypothetical protein
MKGFIFLVWYKLANKAHFIDRDMGLLFSKHFQADDLCNENAAWLRMSDA